MEELKDKAEDGLNKAKETKTNGEVKAFLEVFGFMSDQSRRNIIIFFFVLLVFSNVFFIRQTIMASHEIQTLNDDKVRMVQDLNNRIIEEVRKQVQPSVNRIENTANNVDRVATKLDSLASRPPATMPKLSRHKK
jgi:hypothetical protein